MPSRSSSRQNDTLVSGAPATAREAHALPIRTGATSLRDAAAVFHLRKHLPAVALGMLLLPWASLAQVAFCSYLEHDGQIAILLNRPGRTAVNPFGYAGNGLTVRFDDQATSDIHRYQDHLPAGQPRNAPLTGTWRPDGRITDPDPVLDTDWPTAMPSTFRDGTPGGDWALSVADLEPAGTSRLVRCELEITPIPEPAFATGATAVVLLAMGRRSHPQGGRGAGRNMAGRRRGNEPAHHLARGGPAVLPLAETVRGRVRPRFPPSPASAGAADKSVPATAGSTATTNPATLRPS